VLADFLVGELVDGHLRALAVEGPEAVGAHPEVALLEADEAVVVMIVGEWLFLLHGFGLVRGVGIVLEGNIFEEGVVVGEV
jgi:hypothetical protein